ncbi:MAG: helicase, partial [Planctomycetota bacterium]
LRTAPEHPFKQIVQCRETPHPMLKTAMAAEQYILTPEGWRTIKANRRIDEIARSSRAIAARTNVKLPALVSANRRRGRIFRRNQPGL